MTWYTHFQHRIAQKLRGFHNKRQDAALATACRRLSILSKKCSLTKASNITVFETALTYLLQNIDKPSREFVYKNSSAIIDSTQTADAMHIATRSMLTVFEKRKSSIKSALTIRNFVELLIKDVNGLKPEHRDDIHKAVVLRFAMELPHDKLSEVTKILLPEIIDEKLRKDVMYG